MRGRSQPRHGFDQALLFGKRDEDLGAGDFLVFVGPAQKCLPATTLPLANSTIGW
jgi:hypothetical protein